MTHIAKPKQQLTINIKKDMRKKLSLLLAMLISIPALCQKQVSATSPDGQVQVNVTVSDKVYYDVISHGETLLQQSSLGMTLSSGPLGGSKPVLKGKKIQTVNETVTPIFPLKNSQVPNQYTLLTLTMGGNYQIQWRVYNDGVAYRFVTSLKGEIDILSEEATMRLAQPSELVVQQPNGFKTSCEEFYGIIKSNEWKAEDKMAELPILVKGEKQKILISEHDLFDYPGTFLRGNADNTLNAIQPKCPTEWEDAGDRSHKILKEADYIARTQGTRTFPWRYMLITQQDGQLAENAFPVRLSPKSAIEDTSWIKPGLTTWDWLNGIPYGEGVDFKAGINLDTYKHFVDFAARNGVKYIIMDEGWALDTRDPFKTNPEVNLPELIAYGKSKNVGVIVWLPWLTVEHHMDLFEVFEKWGIVGCKIDFMDRQDQWMVNFYERVSKEAAKHHIMVDYHGAYHPSGMEHKYPNVLSFEGVRGMEYNGSCTTDNTAYIPFIRNAVGAMDFTPGAMICYHPEHFRGGRPVCPGQCTKVYQLALFVLFESHLQMLMDNPVRYDMYPDCRDFLTACPVNWDETHVLAAEVGQYIVTAKRKGDKWYIGGITNSKGHEVTVDLSFLQAGKKYTMTSFEDGPNAHRIAMDYRKKTSTVAADGKLRINMVRNGGFAAVLE